MALRAPDVESLRDRAGVRRAARWACGAAIGAVCLVALGVACQRSWGPVSDWGAMEVATQDVGTLRTPLVGAYSRFGWNHPGPLLTVAYAIPYRLSGSNPNALLLAAGLINTACVAGVLSTCRRRGGTGLLLLGSLGIVALLASVGIGHLIDPWNAWAVFLPFLWFVFACWEVTLGDRRALLVAVVTGSIAAQGHLGYVPYVVALAAWCAVVGLRHGAAHRRERASREAGAGPPADPDAVTDTVTDPDAAPSSARWHRRLLPLGAVALLVALWSLPLLEAVGHRGGNLAAVATGYASALGSTEAGSDAPGDPADEAVDRSSASIADAAALLARTYGTPAWLGFGEPVVYPGAVAPGPLPALVVPLLALVTLAILATRWGWEPGRMAVAISAIGLVTSLLALWAIRGPAYPWLVRPAWAMALFLYLTTAWSLLLLARRRVRQPERIDAALSVIVAVIVVATSATTIAAAGDVQHPRERDSATMAELGAQLDPWLRARGPQDYALHSDGSGLVPAYAGVAAIIGRAGSTALLPGWYGRVFIPGHQLSDAGPAIELVVAEGDAAVASWQSRPYATRLATSRETIDGGRPPEQAVAVFAVPRGVVGRSSDSPPR